MTRDKIAAIWHWLSIHNMINTIHNSPPNSTHTVSNQHTCLINCRDRDIDTPVNGIKSFLLYHFIWWVSRLNMRCFRLWYWPVLMIFLKRITSTMSNCSGPIPAKRYGELDCFFHNSHHFSLEKTHRSHKNWPIGHFVSVKLPPLGYEGHVTKYSYFHCFSWEKKR